MAGQKGEQVDGQTGLVAQLLGLGYGVEAAAEKDPVQTLIDGPDVTEDQEAVADDADATDTDRGQE